MDFTINCYELANIASFARVSGLITFYFYELISF